MLLYLNSNFALTLGYLNPALNNSASIACGHRRISGRFSPPEKLEFKLSSPCFFLFRVNESVFDFSTVLLKLEAKILPNYQ